MWQIHLFWVPNLKNVTNKETNYVLLLALISKIILFLILKKSKSKTNYLVIFSHMMDVLIMFMIL